MSRPQDAQSERSEPRGWRAFEITTCAVGLVLLAPVLILVAIAIRAESGGPVLYRQIRIGQRGRPFTLFKFRTMAANAEQTGPPVTRDGDQRITHVGRSLRRTKLDELPQLMNVLQGEMSLVGPRPEVPEYVALYSAEQRRLLERRPGLADPATLAFLDEGRILERSADPHRTYVEQILPRKLSIALHEQPPPTWRAYLGILLATGRALIGSRQ